MRFSAPPYMYDVLPFPSQKEPWLHTAKWRGVENIFRETARLYGFREIRTPIVEQTELFTRSIGESTDIVSKEMFTFTDRGNRSLTLKPEGTAPAVRACIEHGLFGEHSLLKLYYVGQNFRYERGQKGRYRQHQQLGIEVFGGSDPSVDAEVISVAMAFYRAVGIQKLTLHINSLGSEQSREAYRTALKGYVEPFLQEMSEEGQVRYRVNPLRMLDTKNETDLRLLKNAPIFTDFLDEESRQHFDALQKYLTALDIQYIVDPALVRGFDYYTGTVFEIRGEGLGSQDALGGGGRYDGLVAECGGPQVSGFGFGLGIERCLLALEALGIETPTVNEKPTAFVIAAGSEPEVKIAAMQLLNRMRTAGIAADMDFTGKNFRKQMKHADDLGAAFLLILGSDEVLNGTVQLKDQATRTQEQIKMEDIELELNNRLKH